MPSSRQLHEQLRTDGQRRSDTPGGETAAAEAVERALHAAAALRGDVLIEVLAPPKTSCAARPSPTPTSTQSPTSLTATRT